MHIHKHTRKHRHIPTSKRLLLLLLLLKLNLQWPLHRLVSHNSVTRFQGLHSLVKILTGPTSLKTKLTKHYHQELLAPTDGACLVRRKWEINFVRFVGSRWTYKGRYSFRAGPQLASGCRDFFNRWKQTRTPMSYICYSKSFFPIQRNKETKEIKKRKKGGKQII